MVEDEVSRDVFVVGRVGRHLFCVELLIEGQEITWNKLRLGGKSNKSMVLLRMYTGDPISVGGEAIVAVSYHHKLSMLLLYVVNGTGPSLLGQDWLRHIRLDWKTVVVMTVVSRAKLVDSFLEKYHDVFQSGLGTLKGVQTKLHVKPKAVLRFFRPNSVLFALREAVKKELDRLEQEGVIKKVDHREWAAPIMVVPKGDGRIRICGDYKVTVDGALEVEQYPFPKPEDLFVSLVGGQTFSKLDLFQVYQQIRLDEESQKFVTINTHKGFYRYTHACILVWHLLQLCFREAWMSFFKA